MFRVGIAYAIVAWLVMQIGEVMAPALRLPDWVLSALAFFLILGAPVVLVFAWAFELTPEGIKREAEVERSDSVTSRTGRKLDFVIIAVLIAALGWFAWDRFAREPGPSIASPESDSGARVATVAPDSDPMASPASDDQRKAIAVLPFLNLSAEQENEYFAAGVHEDILTYLSRIAELRVNSRTSVQQYAGTQQNLREVAAALGATFIVEGSVRRAGNRVRVTAQLIDAEHDTHLWAENYDRELTDIFEIQTAVAQEIVAALQAELSPQEASMLARRPTESIEAYDLLLRAREKMQSAADYYVFNPDAHALLEQAVAVDPEYAQAWALLSISFGDDYWWGKGRTPERLQQMKDAVDHAMALQPDLPEAHLALASYYYRGYYDYPKALEQLEIARRLAPSDTLVLYNLGLTLRRLGRYAESVDAFAESTRLDPTATDSWAELLETAMQSFDRQRYWRVLEELPAVYREQERMLGEEALGHLVLDGDLDAAAETLARAPEGSNQYVFLWAQWQHAWWSRDYDGAAKLAMHEDAFNTVTPAFGTSYAVAALKLAGQDAQAQVLLDEALPIAIAAAQAPGAGNFAWPHMALARLLIFAGRPDEALASCATARAILPLSKDKVHGVDITFECSWVKAMAGKADEAMDDLDELFELGWALSAWTLHYDPGFDFLRGNPRFDALATPPAAEARP